MDERRPLKNLHVVITRPRPQALKTLQLFSDSGAQVSFLPLIEIEPIADTTPATQRPQLRPVDLLIFISVNAVRYGLKPASAIFNRADCKIAAIGKKTAQALNDQGIKGVYHPQQGFTSEDFLALAAMQDLMGQKVLIIRGEGGRELLAETLRLRGADVQYMNVYRRVCPPLPAALPLKQLHARQPMAVIALTSSESLHNLLILLGDLVGLKQIPLLTGSQRIAQDARNAGFTSTLIAATDPGDQSMLDALIQWRRDTNNDRQVRQ